MNINIEFAYKIWSLSWWRIMRQRVRRTAHICRICREIKTEITTTDCNQCFDEKKANESIVYFNRIKTAETWKINVLRIKWRLIHCSLSLAFARDSFSVRTIEKSRSPPFQHVEIRIIIIPFIWRHCAEKETEQTHRVKSSSSHELEDSMFARHIQRFNPAKCIRAVAASKWLPFVFRGCQVLHFMWASALSLSVPARSCSLSHTMDSKRKEDSQTTVVYDEWKKEKRRRRKDNIK